MKVKLLAVLNILNGFGDQYNQGELLRWLAEGVWFPTNLLPSGLLHWEPIDALNATLIFDYKSSHLNYHVTFNPQGEITEMETKRYMNKKNLETWIVKLGDYKWMNGIKVPTSNEALWRLKTGDLSYAKFNVTTLEYNIPERF